MGSAFLFCVFIVIGRLGVLFSRFGVGIGRLNVGIVVWEPTLVLLPVRFSRFEAVIGRLGSVCHFREGKVVQELRNGYIGNKIV